MNETVYATAAEILHGMDDCIEFGEVTLVVKGESNKRRVEFTWRATANEVLYLANYYILHKNLKFIISPYDFGKRIAERWWNEVRSRK